MHVDPRCEYAALPIEREEPAALPDRLVQPHILRHKHGTLPTQLQRHPLQIAVRRRDLDLLADYREADLADLHVRTQRHAGFDG